MRKLCAAFAVAALAGCAGYVDTYPAGYAYYDDPVVVGVYGPVYHPYGYYHAYARPVYRRPVIVGHPPGAYHAGPGWHGGYYHRR
jgi:hypothetical protein